FSSRRRHTRFSRDWSSDVCSSDLPRQRVTHLPQIDVWAIRFEERPSQHHALRTSCQTYCLSIHPAWDNLRLFLRLFSAILGRRMLLWVISCFIILPQSYQNLFDPIVAFV